jgi:hypothetical protein
VADADRRLSILLLADDDRRQASNLREHVNALRRYSRHRVLLYNPRDVPSHPHLDLDAFDAVVIHWSLVVIADSYVSPDLREKIRAYQGLKIQLLQDEYRWVDEITAMLRHFEIDVLYTVVPPLAAQQLYAERLPGVEIVETLAGFVPETLTNRRTPPIADRKIDVGYRGRSLPPWLGRLAYEKVEIGRRFLRHARGTGLRCDIAWTEPDRIYGEAWNKFLAGCRTSLGTESGASIADFDRSIEREVQAYLERHRDASFEEIHAAVLTPYEGNVVINVISPRILESAALRTALVLHPGEYSHAVTPWKNYIPLEKDF